MQVVSLLAEKCRRDAERVGIVAALKDLYEHVPRDWSARVRSIDVYRDVAHRLGVAGTNSRWRGKVAACCWEMGARAIVPCGQRWFIWFRRRTTVARPVNPTRKITYKELGVLRRRWYARARGDGFDDIESPDGTLRKGVSQRALDTPGWWLTRSELNGAYFQKRKDAFWRLREALDVWELYVVEALSVRDIEQRTGLGRDKVHRTVKAFERWMVAGQPGIAKETSEDGQTLAGE